MSLVGCGEIVTKPTPTPVPPTATATPTPETTTKTPSATPTVTPAPATPAPTSTPTLEPTPIIYTLKAGDTLIGLAGQFGVTVQAIQEANGITDPRGLLVGQQIVIPTDPEARLNAGTPTPNPTPPPIQISPLTFWRHTGALWALGEVASQSDRAVEDVIVQVDLLDETGAIIATATTPIQQYMLAPGEKAGFDLRFLPPPGAFARYYARVISARPAHVAFYHRDLTIENVLAQQSGESIYVLSGEIVNAGTEPARTIYVSAVLYDDEGRVIAVRRVAADPPELQPGETAFFSAEFLPIRFPVADYQLLAEGQRPPSSND